MTKKYRELREDNKRYNRRRNNGEGRRHGGTEKTATNIPSGFGLRIQKSASVSREGTGQMTIIVRCPYVHLVTELKRIFKGNA